MTDSINSMNFEELCEHVRSQYGDILPDAAYSSPQSLIDALESFENAKGYKSRYQVRAFMVLQACVLIPKKIFTVEDLAEFSGLSKGNISECICKWMKWDYRYLTRLPKRLFGGAYRYKLRKHGIDTYLALRKRILKNFDLNRMKYIPKKVDCYFYIDKIGRTKGLTPEDMPEILMG